MPSTVLGVGDAESSKKIAVLMACVTAEMDRKETVDIVSEDMHSVCGWWVLWEQVGQVRGWRAGLGYSVKMAAQGNLC